MEERRRDGDDGGDGRQTKETRTRRGENEDGSGTRKDTMELQDRRQQTGGDQERRTRRDKTRTENRNSADVVADVGALNQPIFNYRDRRSTTLCRLQYHQTDSISIGMCMRHDGWTAPFALEQGISNTRKLDAWNEFRTWPMDDAGARSLISSVMKLTVSGGLSPVAYGLHLFEKRPY